MRAMVFVGFLNEVQMLIENTGHGYVEGNI